jgi:hypothetical protein
MAKKKKTTQGGGLFGFFSKSKKTTRSRSKKQKTFWTPGVRIAVGIIVSTLLVAAAAVGFIYMDRYVKTSRPAEKTVGPLAYALPAWVNQQWKDSIYDVIGEGPFALDETSARTIAQKLETISWLSGVTAQVLPEYIKIDAEYHRPVGIVDLGRAKYYLDKQMTVMDYIPVTAFTTPEIKGIGSPRSIPVPGTQWAAEDVAAAVQLLDMLYKMDDHFELEKPLLDEIESIDVSNFAARKTNAEPHITLTVTDGTKIFWGAAWGQASRYLEQDELNKLTDLYQHFMDHNNTLQGSAKYIELRQL